VRLWNLLFVCLLLAAIGCSAEDVRNDAARTAEDEAYIQQIDGEIDDEEQGDAQ